MVLFIVWFSAWGSIDRERAADSLAAEMNDRYNVAVSPEVVAPLVNFLLDPRDGHPDGTLTRENHSVILLWGDEQATVSLGWKGDEWVIMDATVEEYVEMAAVGQEED